MNVNRTELIEAYLNGKLSQTEKVAFEAQLEQDPLFKSEMDLQQDIINSIKTYRKAQLKQRLSNIDVGSSAVNFSAIKIAASVMITAFLGFGGYYYFSSTQITDQSSSSLEQNIQEKIIEPSIKSPETIKNESNIVKNEPNALKSKEETSTINKEKQSTQQISSPKASNSNNKNAIVVSPNVIDNFNENPAIVKDSGMENVAKFNTTINDKISNIEIINEDSKSNDLRYKYLNKKLYLYGNFSTATYELLELNSSGNKKLFLYHNGTYYQLNDKQKNIAPLKPISDSIVISELDTLRENKTFN